MTRLRRITTSPWHARGARVVSVLLAFLAAPELLYSHSGPPFPIVSDAVRGPYTISIWTDPDATDDGSPGGQFWVVLGLTQKGARIPPDVRVTVSVRPVIRRTPKYNQPIRRAAITAAAEPVRNDTSNRFAALVMDHEGPYEVRVDIDGPPGRASIDSRVDATYDLRPPPYMLAWYLAPFLLVGLLWTRLLLRRRTVARKR